MNLMNSLYYRLIFFSSSKRYTTYALLDGNSRYVNNTPLDKHTFTFTINLLGFGNIPRKDCILWFRFLKKCRSYC